ncbi:uncharacterized [Tachysurus ichikawai]
MKDTTVSFKRQPPLWSVCRIYLEEEKRRKLKKRGRRCQRELDGGEERRRKVRGERLEESEMGSQAPCCQRAEKPPAVLALE